MAERLILKASLRYGTSAGPQGEPTAADLSDLDKVCRQIAADMGQDAYMVSVDPTATLRWPHKHLELSYSAFNPNAGQLHELARSWAPKLESHYGMAVSIISDCE